MNIEKLIEAEAEASEQNRDAEIGPGTTVTRGHGRTRTLRVRMNAEELEALSAAAEQRGVPASTLARDLLLASLASQQGDPQAVIARIRADLATLASSVA